MRTFIVLAVFPVNVFIMITGTPMTKEKFVNRTHFPECEPQKDSDFCFYIESSRVVVGDNVTLYCVITNENYRSLPSSSLRITAEDSERRFNHGGDALIKYLLLDNVMETDSGAYHCSFRSETKTINLTVDAWRIMATHREPSHEKVIKQEGEALHLSLNLIIQRGRTLKWRHSCRAPLKDNDTIKWETHGYEETVLKNLSGSFHQAQHIFRKNTLQVNDSGRYSLIISSNGSHEEEFPNARWDVDVIPREKQHNVYAVFAEDPENTTQKRVLMEGNTLPVACIWLRHYLGSPSLHVKYDFKNTNYVEVTDVLHEMRNGTWENARIWNIRVARENKTSFCCQFRKHPSEMCDSNELYAEFEAVSPTTDGIGETWPPAIHVIFPVIIFLLLTISVTFSIILYSRLRNRKRPPKSLSLSMEDLLVSHSRDTTQKTPADATAETKLLLCDSRVECIVGSSNSQETRKLAQAGACPEIAPPSNDSGIASIYQDDRPSDSEIRTSSETPLKCIKMIGTGNSGVVYKAKICNIRNEQMDVAAKTGNNTQNQQLLVEEAKQLAVIPPQQNILFFIRTIQHEEKTFLLTEFCDFGDLQNFLTNKFTSMLFRSELSTENGKIIYNIDKDAPFQSKVIRTTHLLCFAFQIACGMHHLQRHNCIHRDLAARNVLITNRLVAKIADFGLTRQTDVRGYYTCQRSIQLPKDATPPEVWETKRSSEKSDSWAFGRVLSDIFSLCCNVYSNTEYSQSDERRSRERECHPQIKAKLISKCLSADKNQRPDFKFAVDFLSEHIAMTAPRIFDTLLSEIREEGTRIQRLREWCKFKDGATAYETPNSVKVEQEVLQTKYLSPKTSTSLFPPLLPDEEEVFVLGCNQ